MVSLCDACVGRNVCGYHLSHRWAWLGVFYFIFLTAFAIYGAIANQNTNLYFTWFIFCVVFRILDLLTSLFTAIRRRIDPRRRAKYSLIAFLARIATFIGELTLAIVGIVILSKDHTVGLTENKAYAEQCLSLIAYFLNFGTLILFYGFFLSPCGCAICCLFAQFTESTRDDDERAFDERRNVNNAPVNADEGIHRAFAPNPPEEQSGWLAFVKKIGLSDMLGTDDLECVICLVKYQDSDELSKLLCGHTFHTQCLVECFKSNSISKTCPLCRQPFESATDKRRILT